MTTRWGAETTDAEHDSVGADESQLRSGLPSWSNDEVVEAGGRIFHRSGERHVRCDERGDSHPEGSLRLQRQLAELQARAEAAEAALDSLVAGVFTLAADGWVLHANRRGEQIVAACDGLALRNNRLHCASPREAEQLDAAVERATGDRRDGGVRRSTLAVSRPSLRRPFGVVVAPLRERQDPQTLRLVTAPQRRAAVLVTVTDPESVVPPSAERLTCLFDLTPAEARLAAALAARQTTAEYAAQTGITPGTARWTLKRVLQKTGCRRQSELMLLLAASVTVILGG
jgi:DNA-binding CsgD family transcriptional regulator/PAS domain-containing protein